MNPTEDIHSASPLGGVLRRLGELDAVELLSERLGRSQLTTLLLDVFRRRAGRRSPTDVLRQFEEDRFIAASQQPFAALRSAEDVVIGALEDTFELVTLSPLMPLGTHSALATVDQNKVITTIRGSEVAADPTNGLALEAAHRRRAAIRRGDPPPEQRLAAIQRVVRAQHFAGAPAASAHFGLVGLVSAGRDTGSLAFERAALLEHLSLAATILERIGRVAELRITVFDPRFEPLTHAMHEAFAAHAGTRVLDDPARQSGRGYYAGLSFKVVTFVDGSPIEIGDGGMVDWTQALVGSRKERLFISGLGLDRLAAATAAAR